MNLDEILLHFLTTRRTYPIQKITLEYSKNDSHDDFSTTQLLSLSSCFLYAVHNESIPYLLEFDQILTDLKVVQKPILILIERFKKQVETRDERFELLNYKSDFNLQTVDLDNREWVFSLLNYLYILSFEESRFLQELQIVKNKPVEGPVKQGLKVINVEASRDLLQRFNKPTMTVDEYVDIVMKNMNETVNIENEVMKSKEDKRHELESKEYGNYRSGNRGGMG